MKEIKCWKDGKWVPASKLSIETWDAHYFFGWAVFDAFRTYNHELHLVEEHIDRLYKSAKLTGIDIKYTKEELLDIIYKVINKNKKIFENDEYRFMIFATPGNFKIFKDYGSTEPRLSIQLTTVSRYAKFVYPKLINGCRAMVVNQKQIPSRFLDSKIKSCSRLHYGLANLEVSHYGEDVYPIILDEYGNIAESSGANVCFIDNDSILHIPDTRDALEGRTLNYLKHLLNTHPSHIVDIKKGKYQPYDLIDSNLILFTSTYGGFIPANRFIYRGREYKLSDMPNPYFDSIMDIFSNDIGYDILNQWEKWYNDECR